ncbi:hypothetical protein TNCV_1912961 [Trichonephila clavipes]|nr:hypothetical protein TNCV_1912961 [Trichonephila clavipes]
MSGIVNSGISRIWHCFSRVVVSSRGATGDPSCRGSRLKIFSVSEVWKFGEWVSAQIRSGAGDMCIDTKFRGQNEKFGLDDCIKDNPNLGGEQCEIHSKHTKPVIFVHCRLPLLRRSFDLILIVSDTKEVTAVAKWSRYRIVAGPVTSSNPVPPKTLLVGKRCTLNLSRAQTYPPVGVVDRRGGASSGVVDVI